MEGGSSKVGTTEEQDSGQEDGAISKKGRIQTRMRYVEDLEEKKNEWKKEYLSIFK